MDPLDGDTGHFSDIPSLVKERSLSPVTISTASQESNLRPIHIHKHMYHIKEGVVLKYSLVVLFYMQSQKLTTTNQIKRKFKWSTTNECILHILGNLSQLHKIQTGAKAVH